MKKNLSLSLVFAVLFVAFSATSVHAASITATTLPATLITETGAVLNASINYSGVASGSDLPITPGFYLVGFGLINPTTGATLTPSSITSLDSSGITNFSYVFDRGMCGHTYKYYVTPGNAGDNIVSNPAPTSFTTSPCSTVNNVTTLTTGVAPASVRSLGNALPLPSSLTGAIPEKFTATYMGASDDNVRAIGDSYKKIGLLDADANTSVFGNSMQSATFAFQVKNRIPANGKFDIKTAMALTKIAGNKTKKPAPIPVESKPVDTTVSNNNNVGNDAVGIPTELGGKPVGIPNSPASDSNKGSGGVVASQPGSFPMSLEQAQALVDSLGLKGVSATVLTTALTGGGVQKYPGQSGNSRMTLAQAKALLDSLGITGAQANALITALTGVIPDSGSNNADTSSTGSSTGTGTGNNTGNGTGSSTTPNNGSGGMPRGNNLNNTPARSGGMPVSQVPDGRGFALGALDNSQPVASDTPAQTKYVFTQSMSYGSTGQGVAELQNVLSASGYLNTQELGEFYGKATMDAVKKFQKANNIDQTGVVGPMTLDALNK